MYSDGNSKTVIQALIVTPLHLEDRLTRMLDLGLQGVHVLISGAAGGIGEHPFLNFVSIQTHITQPVRGTDRQAIPW